MSQPQHIIYLYQCKSTRFLTGDKMCGFDCELMPSTSTSLASTSTTSRYRRAWCTYGGACITYICSTPFSRAVQLISTSSTSLQAPAEHEDVEARGTGDADLHREHHPSPAVRREKLVSPHQKKR